MRKLWVIILLLVSVSTVNFTLPTVITHDPFEDPDWDLFTEAVVWKESRGNVDAVGDSGKAVGPLQIWPIMVREANRVGNRSGADAFTYDDRKTVEGSKAIWNQIQTHYNPNHDFVKALKIWNPKHPDSYRKLIFDKYQDLYWETYSPVELIW